MARFIIKVKEDDGSFIPLRTVDQFQRLLKQEGHHENLLNSLNVEL